jgi:hypothetical protein
MLSAARAARVEANPFLEYGGTDMWSMWNAPTNRDYYDPFGAYCVENEGEICEDCAARWDLGEACEDWCETNRPVPEPVPVSCLAAEEQEVYFFEEAQSK